MAGALVAVGCSASAVLGGCSVISSTLVKAPVKDLVLTVAEIPYPGFVVEHGSASAGYYSDARVAGKDKALLDELRKAGRDSGYEADFDRDASPVAAIGPIVIESSASIYSTATGAEAGLRLVDQQTLAGGASAISTGTIGQQTFGFTSTEPLDGTTYEAFVVAWREDNVVAGIEIEGNAATLDIQYATSLAKLQANRLKAS
jgi:hypothetical protein